ncbi:MAG TPA: amidohydrolase family protein [Baekduia sp.]|uniref:amidohydrolase family protein n=1 Tax=Baekduia sp. TaxID=2600305 RepID=UPI002D7757C2|nr:amidohydrolase family protein [Baekduia sp.]HET6509063.1 amidohydrolase family protein [Baekduia sp.]
MADKDFFVLDAVVHPFNFDKSNYAEPEGARAMAEMAAAFASTAADEGYQLDRELFMRDWTVDELANILFRESRTDAAVIMSLPVFSFKDGLSSLEKSLDALERYPTRFVGGYACVDPMRGKDALVELERQVELFKPYGGALGLKMYPASWHDGKIESWKMNDPKIAYPVIEKALELGLRHVAVHKSIPIEPIEFGDAFNPSDFEGAAVHFPEMNFEIVHGGVAFIEETALLLARFPNIYVNMENLNMVVARRPRVMAQIMLGLMHEGGQAVMQKLFWGTGTTQYHPRPCVEAMKAFTFPEDLLERYGLYIPLEQITDEDKQGLFAGNFCRLHGLDLDAIKAGQRGDAFSDVTELEAPWSNARPLTPAAA